MEIKLKLESQVIDWRDGGKLKLRRLSDKQRSEILNDCEKKGITNQEVITDIMIENTIEGWDEITTEGKPLDFGPKNRHQVFVAVKGDPEMLMKIIIFISGPLGNSKAGLTSTLTINGASENAANASENIKKTASPASGKAKDANS